jgi:zinc protease
MNYLLHSKSLHSKSLHLESLHSRSSYLKLTLPILSISLAMSVVVHAEPHPSSTPSSVEITSLKHLESLKNPVSMTQLRRPNVQEFKTSSGTRVLFVDAPELPIVDIRLVFDAGSARDSELKQGQYGLATLTSQLLAEGTSTQTTDQISANFERLGAQFGVAAYRDMFTVNLRTLSDSNLLNPAVEQLLSILKDAQIPQVSYDRIMQQDRIGLAAQKDSPSATANIRFWQDLYGKHPYAQPTTGTLASIELIKPADIRKFKDTYLVAHNLNIAITGQMTLAQAQALAERITQSLPQGEHARPLPKPDTMTARTVYVPFDSTQTHVLIGEVSVTRNNPDLPALTVGNDVFGGGDFSAILMQELRVKRGLTYGAYSGFSPMRSNGPFILNYSTRSDQTDESLKVAKQALRDYIQKGVPLEKLNEAKMGILNSYPLSLSSNGNIASFLASMGFYGLPSSYLADYPKQIEAVTPESAHAAFVRYVHPDAMLTVVLGKEKPKVDDNVDNSGSAESTNKPTQQ